MAADQDWVRLGRYIVGRRVALGMPSARQLAEETRRVSPPGISERTLSKLELGQSPSHPARLAMIELALRWTPGSAAAVLSGREPAEMQPQASRAAGRQGGQFEDPAFQRIWETPGLTEAERLDAIAAIRARREKMTRAGFTEEEQWVLENAPAAFAELVRRERERRRSDGDDDSEVRGQSALPG